MKKGFAIGLATGLTIAGASLVLANSQIQAILNNQIKVTLNGQVQEFKDETTNETQYPITYHDRTYLPLRTVANLVGVDVDYDANSNTAVLSSTSNDLVDESKYAIVERLVKEELKKWPGVKDVIVNDIYVFTPENAQTKIEGTKETELADLGNMNFYYSDYNSGLLENMNAIIVGDVEYTLVFNSENDLQSWLDDFIAGYGPSHTYKNYAIRASGFRVIKDNNGQYKIEFGNG